MGKGVRGKESMRREEGKRRRGKCLTVAVWGFGGLGRKGSDVGPWLERFFPEQHENQNSMPAQCCCLATWGNNNSSSSGDGQARISKCSCCSSAILPHLFPTDRERDKRA